MFFGSCVYLAIQKYKPGILGNLLRFRFYLRLNTSITSKPLIIKQINLLDKINFQYILKVQ